MADPKVLFFDIETAPTLARVWSVYQADAVEVENYWYMLCFAAKWRGQKKVSCSALPDFEGYTKDPENDLGPVQELHALLDAADIVIGHNSDHFDIKKANARFLYHGLTPPSPFQTVDTLKVARKHFKVESNRLDYLGQFLGVGRKVQTGGYSLWKGCMQGDDKSWAKMKKYNRQDVQLLEDVYDKMLPWIDNHPNLNVFDGRDNCTNCGGNLMKDGVRVNRTGKWQQYKCRECGKYSKGEFIKGSRAVIK